MSAKYVCKVNLYLVIHSYSISKRFTHKMGQDFLDRQYTVCPRSSGPFYVVTCGVMVYKIDFYAYLLKINIYFSSFRFKV